jgi:hypothetical protein
MRCFPAAALLSLAAGLPACAHLGSTPAPVPPGVTLAMDVGVRGEVIFQVPNGWKATSGESEPPVPGSIQFEPPTGHFIIIVTPLWGPGESTEPLGPEVARVLVEAGRDRALEGSVEMELPVRPLQPPGLAGWYFAATDRELAEAKRPPEPDEYRCLVQGAAVAGPLVLAFTLLDDGDGPQREVALALVRGATHRPVPKPGAAAPPSEPPGRTHVDPSTWAIHGDEPLELGLPGKAWSLLLDLPGWRVAQPMRRFDGSGVSVIGQRKVDGLILSAAMVDSRGRRSSESCRDPDWARIGRLAGVGDARLEARAGEARAWYTVRDEGPPTRHLSAWRYRDDTCIHLHLSLPGAEPGVDAKLETALGAARYGEAL